jgi:recombination protein RecA
MASKRGATAKDAEKPKNGKKKAKKPDLASVKALTGSLAQAIKKKVANKDDVNVLQDDLLSDVEEWLPTGFANLDEILGGGWPVGRISEIFGKEGSGKSALSHIAVKSCLDIGGLCYYIDTENSLEKRKLVQLGIDESRVIRSTPKDVEECWDTLWACLDTIDGLKTGEKPPILIVWDSIAASIPRDEWEAASATDKKRPAGLAKSMSEGCRKAYRRVARSDVHLMFINQLRTQFGGSGGFGTNQATVGGVAVDYAATTRVKVWRAFLKKTVNKVARKIGYTVTADIEKNKIFPPHQSCKWILDFRYGPSPEFTMFHFLIGQKVIKTTSGGYYQAPWTEVQFRRGQWLKRMEDVEFREAAEAAYLQQIAETSFFHDLVADDEDNGAD